MDTNASTRCRPPGPAPSRRGTPRRRRDGAPESGSVEARRWFAASPTAFPGGLFEEARKGAGHRAGGRRPPARCAGPERQRSGEGSVELATDDDFRTVVNPEGNSGPLSAHGRAARSAGTPPAARWSRAVSAKSSRFPSPGTRPPDREGAGRQRPVPSRPRRPPALRAGAATVSRCNGESLAELRVGHPRNPPLPTGPGSTSPGRVGPAGLPAPGAPREESRYDPPADEAPPLVDSIRATRRLE